MRSQRFRTISVILFAVTLQCCATLDARPPGEGPEPALALGEKLTLSSKTLGERREAWIVLPEGYAESPARYPVLYLLDAENDFLHVAGVVGFLVRIDRIPEMILVGVVNTNRSRDLTPPSNNAEETAFWDEVGGADRFKAFLRDELLPTVDRRYRTQPYRILRGQSFGGLFALFDYASAEPVFDAVIASSPAVGWNCGALVEAAPSLFEAGVPRPRYVASASKDSPRNLANVLAFARIVDERAGDSDRWRHDAFATEGHYSLHHRSTYRGLEFLFSAWPVPDDVAAAADFEACERYYAALSDRFGYEIRIPMRSIVRIGNQILREQRFDDGIAVFLQARELYPDLPEAHWRVGEAYRLAGRFEAAIAPHQRAYELAQQQELSDLEEYAASLEKVKAAARQR